MIPGPLLKEILEDPFYETCVRFKEGTCRGRVTFEHALQHASRQVQAKFAIVPLCAYHHEVDQYQDCGDLQKEIGQWVALNRAKRTDFDKYPRNDWAQRKRYLNAKYGKWNG